MENLKLLAADETGKQHPSGLGLLLFSPEPDRWIRGAYIDLTVYEGPEPDAARQRDAKLVRGTIVGQIEATVKYLQASPYIPVPATKDEWGCQVHRDYTPRGSQVPGRH